MKKYLLSLVVASGLVSSGSVAFADSSPTTELQGEEAVSQHFKAVKESVAKLSGEDRAVMKQCQALLNELQGAYRDGSLSANDVEKILTAIEFAAEKHRLQTRQNKARTPYIVHPLGVAYYVIHTGKVSDAAVIMGALLHDTVEDTKTSFDELEDKFGKQVTSYVREVTDDKKLTTEERKRLQVINASHKSDGAAQIKLADKLYNITDLLNDPPEGWSQQRIDAYYEWAQAVVDRLPPANADLKAAVNEVINTYWEKQAR